MAPNWGGNVKTSTLISPLMSDVLPQTAMIGIAASIGGPRILAEILSALPHNFPVPIVVAQHIAQGFDHGFVTWLQQMCRLQVKLAEQGTIPRHGEILVVPAGMALRFSTAKTMILEPISSTAAADTLFTAIAQVYGQAGMGIILTRAGQDGSTGLAQLYRVGGMTLAQDEASCIVPDMPFAALQNKAVTQVVPLNKIAHFLSNIVTQQQLLGA
jgi:two-component system, chemotaxis family, protein-glutamate methylesterase/glutaminase